MKLGRADVGTQDAADNSVCRLLLKKKKIIDTRKKQEAKKGRKLDDVEAQKLADGMRAHWAKNGICEKERASFSRIALFESIQDLLEGIVGSTMVALWEQHNYLNYIANWKGLASGRFASGDVLLDKDYQDLFTNVVYKHRNRCAHNLASFQSNLPTLKTLTEEGFVYDNYYYRFSILMLLDEVFMRLYKAYVAAIG